MTEIGGKLWYVYSPDVNIAWVCIDLYVAIESKDKRFVHAVSNNENIESV